MLDIMDKNGRVVAVLMDNGDVIKKENITDDIEKLIQESLEKAKRAK